ncbi:uncharacterized protein UV8b_00992 [Ustilaginoidea virens]|uniref:Ankyrin repeat protein n=1 Tax=Ustilaginoidea virens TaxID=1159556 RepID=A0A8E5HJS2_USTVR|nr:uncharacterized protein UV8b_00992 [Ustilaginoidea virens]QUC16751.1 hypothetical protein UV8b_00992 [Ustilaginoidea virens]
MASPSNHVSSALNHAVRSIGPVFLTATVLLRNDGCCQSRKTLLEQLLQQLTFISGLLYGLQALAQRYESLGIAVERPAASYAALHRCETIFGHLLRNLQVLTEDEILELLEATKSICWTICCACSRVHTLSSIHHSLGPADAPCRPASDAVAANDTLSPDCSIPKDDMKTSKNRPLMKQPGRLKRSRPDNMLTRGRALPSVDAPMRLRPSTATVQSWMRVLNSPWYDRAPLEYSLELWQLEARNRVHPIYREAALGWFKYAKQEWSSIDAQVVKLFSRPHSSHFIQWALEFARMHLSTRLQPGNNQTLANHLIDLTEDLGFCRTTPLHFAAMLGLSDLCKAVANPLNIGAVGIYGSALYCAFVGPPVLLLRSQPPSWDVLIQNMEPTNQATIRTLVALGADCDFRLRLADAPCTRAQLANVAFIASVMMKDPTVFRLVMDTASCQLTNEFTGLLGCQFFRKVAPESRGVLSELTCAALDYTLANDSECWPWDEDDEMGEAIAGVMKRNNLSYDTRTRVTLGFIPDDLFESAVRQCILHGSAPYFQRLSMDYRFHPDLCAVQDEGEEGTILHLAGRTPLLVVEDLDTLNVLVKQLKASTKATDKDGRNIWHCAAATNDVTILDWLCHNDPCIDENINALNKLGRCPLAEALMYGESLSREIKKSIPPRPLAAYRLVEEPLTNCRAVLDDAHRPISHLAVEWGELRLVELLAARGMDFRATCDKGRTALHCLSSAAEPGLVTRLLHLCDGLPMVSGDGFTPLETIFDNSFPSTCIGLCPSNHPSCHKVMDKAVLESLVSHETLHHHNAAGDGCWALFCAAVTRLLRRCMLHKEGITKEVEYSFLNGVMCLSNQGALEAHGRETGKAGVLCFASDGADSDHVWGLQVSRFVGYVLGPCAKHDAEHMAAFYQSQEAMWLLLEAFFSEHVKIVGFLAGKVPLHHPVERLGGRSILHLVMGSDKSRPDCFKALARNSHFGKVGSFDRRLCDVILAGGTTCAVAKIGLLIDRGLKPDIPVISEIPEESTTLLAEAVSMNYTDLVKMLLERGAHPGFGRSVNAITAAVERDDTDMLSLLASKLDESFSWDFSVCHAHVEGYNTIDVAIARKSHRALEMLLAQTEMRMIVNSPSAVNRGTPAHFAARRDDVGSLQLLHKYGADFSMLDDEGRSVLEAAKSKATQRVVSELMGAAAAAAAAADVCGV